MSSQPLFHGSLCALVTPFKDGAVDEKALGDLVEWHVSEGTHGLIPVGTTGESPTLSHDEHHRVVKLTIEAAAGRAMIMAGAGSNSTETAIEFAQHADKNGADGLLVVVPYYNKPNAEGLKQHFLAIAEKVSKPIFIYDVPGRSAIGIADTVVAELSAHENIAGIKDATADVLRPFALRQLCGEDFIQLTGEDASVLPYRAMGGHGCISVSANVVPGHCAAFHNAWEAGELAKAQEINNALMPLHGALFSDTSPQPTKYAMNKLGKCAEDMRLPLVRATTAAQDLVDDALRGLNLLGS